MGFLRYMRRTDGNVTGGKTPEDVEGIMTFTSVEEMVQCAGSAETGTENLRLHVNLGPYGGNRGNDGGVPGASPIVSHFPLTTYTTQHMLCRRDISYSHQGSDFCL